MVGLFLCRNMLTAFFVCGLCVFCVMLRVGDLLCNHIDVMRAVVQLLVCNLLYV